MLRSSSTRRLPFAVSTTSAWRRETVASSKRMSAAAERPIRVQPGSTRTTASVPSSSAKARYRPAWSISARASSSHSGAATAASSASVSTVG